MAGDFHWLNEPASWKGDEHHLVLTTGRDTDFWQRTFYGFQRDDGHAYLTSVSGDFTATLLVRGEYEALYDQAGLMLRIDESRWLKTGIEYTDGMMHFSVVVTNGVSDWSVIPLPSARTDDTLSIRLTRHDDAVRIQFAVNNDPWQLARLAPFSAAKALIGPMACSPQREGFTAEFEKFVIGAPIARDLHTSSD